jgi:hypothetical protein
MSGPGRTPHERIPPKPDESVGEGLRARTSRYVAKEHLDEASRMVRMIASDPVKIAWLREHGARLLERAATSLDAPSGEKTAGQRLRALAKAHREGETALW